MKNSDNGDIIYIVSGGYSQLTRIVLDELKHNTSAYAIYYAYDDYIPVRDAMRDMRELLGVISVNPLRYAADTAHERKVKPIVFRSRIIDILDSARAETGSIPKLCIINTASTVRHVACWQQLLGMMSPSVALVVMSMLPSSIIATKLRSTSRSKVEEVIDFRRYLMRNGMSQLPDTDQIYERLMLDDVNWIWSKYETEPSDKGNILPCFPDDIVDEVTDVLDAADPYDMLTYVRKAIWNSKVNMDYLSTNVSFTKEPEQNPSVI